MNNFKAGCSIKKKVSLLKFYSVIQIVFHSLAQQAFTIFHIKYGVMA